MLTSGVTQVEIVCDNVPGTDAESRGVIMEDFGEMTAQAVDIGGNHFADPARRWAVLLDAGTLVFADTDQLLLE